MKNGARRELINVPEHKGPVENLPLQGVLSHPAYGGPSATPGLLAKTNRFPTKGSEGFRLRFPDSELDSDSVRRYRNPSLSFIIFFL